MTDRQHPGRPTSPGWGRRTAMLLVPGLLALAACTGPAATPTPAASDTAPTPTTSPTPTASESTTLTVVTHDSFALSQELLDEFAAQTGYTVTYVAPGDAGSLTNQLVLTKDSPLGDVVFGIDNTFAGRALDEDVVVPYVAEALPEQEAATFAADDTHRLTPIDFGDVCINADLAWFAEHELGVPTTLEDLADPAYRDLLVVSSPATSSPGLAFLIATVEAQGEDGYLDYWQRLRDNGLLVAQDWTEAYTVQFSGSSGQGPRPLVLSYATSPSFEVVDGATHTGALLGTCFRQVEYAGVIAGAQNEVGAQKFIEFLLSDAVQADIPEQMYMYPVQRSVELPAEWVEFAPLAQRPYTMTPEAITEGRDTWIRDWATTVIG
ncbi:thiamine ABC transporter substrate binding subunit [Propioniciclava soli]|uniref:thiamine ABC transporter substrate-binding protein n=1 Tax=Propioniciclava soli TaxID=2775081 RepID=UPI001E34E805|nr:thiamine ABC transporter substrate-binding protein [Propioniciclava soli]